MVIIFIIVMYFSRMSELYLSLTFRKLKDSLELNISSSELKKKKPENLAISTTRRIKVLQKGNRAFGGHSLAPSG